jgi:benzoyl-CoA reductase/2-hydroxyglutaryl-CoA dehydratase subunit BcrC/BadD/HgdB
MIERTLPRSFEDFNEARKRGFLAAKEYKEQGGKLAGCLCSYTPLEVIDAAGMAAIGLCGMSDEAIPDAETVLPKNLCPLIKGTYGFALTEKCPYTYFSDLIVGETTCDGKKKMYELLADLKDVHVLHLPQSQARSWAADIWYEEVKLLVQELERRFDVSITDEKLRDAVRLRNRYRRALVRLYELQRSEPPAMRGVELMSTLLASTFSFDVETFVAQLEALGDERARAYAEGERPVCASAKRIMLTGCPSGGVINKVGKAIEDNGGVVVCLDDCSGERTNRLMVDEDADNILRAIADRYLAINCSVMTPNEGRLDNAAAMARAYRVDGVVEVVLQACHTFNVEAEHVRRRMEAEGIPYLKLETDYSQGDTGQVETRLGAFLEMV